MSDRVLGTIRGTRYSATGTGRIEQKDAKVTKEDFASGLRLLVVRLRVRIDTLREGGRRGVRGAGVLPRFMCGETRYPSVRFKRFR